MLFIPKKHTQQSICMFRHLSLLTSWFLNAGSPIFFVKSIDIYLYDVYNDPNEDVRRRS